MRSFPRSVTLTYPQEQGPLNTQVLFQGRKANTPMWTILKLASNFDGHLCAQMFLVPKTSLTQFLLKCKCTTSLGARAGWLEPLTADEYPQIFLPIMMKLFTFSSGLKENVWIIWGTYHKYFLSIGPWEIIKFTDRPTFFNTKISVKRLLIMIILRIIISNCSFK